MKKATNRPTPRVSKPGLTRQAALASGLVLPGLGQWLLGRRGKGCLTMLIFTALVVFMGARIFLLVHAAIFGGVAMSSGGSWLADLHHRAYAENWWLLVPILLIWIWSVIDAVRTGKRIEAALKTGKKT